MAADRTREILYLREKAKRLRQIADEHRTEVSPHLRELAADIESWAEHLESRRGERAHR